MSTKTPTATAIKVANEAERVTLRAVLKRNGRPGEVEWTECPCGWFYVGSLCPDEKCKAVPKTIKTKLYAHVDDGDEFSKGRELGLSMEASTQFSNWGYELEFEAEVNPKTGEVKLLTVDGHKIQY